MASWEEAEDREAILLPEEKRVHLGDSCVTRRGEEAKNGGTEVFMCPIAGEGTFCLPAESEG